MLGFFAYVFRILWEEAKGALVVLALVGIFVAFIMFVEFLGWLSGHR